MASTLDSLRHTKTILLTTYRRDGTPIGTPVSIAFDGERAFFRSYDKAWKTKNPFQNERESGEVDDQGRRSRHGSRVAALRGIPGRGCLAQCHSAPSGPCSF